MKKTLKDCIINSENAPALAVVREQFGNWLDATMPGYMEESFTPQDRLNVVYNSDKVTFLESYIGSNGMAGISGSLVQIPGLTGLSYSNTIISGVSLGLLNPAILQYVNTPSPQNIDTDTLWLAEHHLYGSSRLGIKQYEPHQYRNVYSNTQPFVKGINVKQPWYSLGMEEMIKSGIKAVPLLSSHYLVDTFRYKRDLGTKYYELSDHLTNVLATVLDRKTGYGSLNGEYAGFRADIASATDYYPFGMEMPGRSFSSENSRFGFNGQEKDNEVAGDGVTTEFKYRSYDARIGRFKSMDPLHASYPWNSTYAFAENRVIDGVDLEGLEYAWAMDKLADKISGSAPVVAGVIRGLAPFTGAPGVDDAINAVTNLVSPPPPPSSKDVANQAINSIPFVYGVRKISEGGEENVAEGVTNLFMTGLVIRQGVKSNSVKSPKFDLKYKPSNGVPFNRSLVGTIIDNVTKQAEHIEGSKPYLNRIKVTGRFPSVLTEDAGSLLKDFHAGKGTVVSNNPAHKSVIVRFEKPIGNVIDPSTGKVITKGLIMVQLSMVKILI